MRKRLLAFLLCCSATHTVCASADSLKDIFSNNNQPVDYTFFDESSFKQDEADSDDKTDDASLQDIDFTFYNNPFAFSTFDTPTIQAKYSGFIEYVAWWANRQGVGDGDIFEILFPKRPLYDPDCRDINAHPDSAMTILDTRFRTEFFGPEVLKASTFGFIESDVFGFDITDLRFRLWHAFFQLTWDNAKLLLGQFWHPFSVVNCFPITVTVDNGSPITPNSRNPQIRYTLFHGYKKLLFAAVAQSEFSSDGPIGNSSTYLRNARVPILVVRGTYDNDHNIYYGLGILFQRLKPRLESDTGYDVHESINSVQATAFTTLKFRPIEIRQQLTYAQNGNALTLLGGFAVASIDPVTDQRTYTNLPALSYWADFNINQKIEPGLFIGIIKNIGSRKEIIQCIEDPITHTQTSTIYSQGPDINSVFKCYPRVRFHAAPFDFACEFEYTRATYGCINEKGKVINTQPVNHLRLLVASYFYF